ncbi:F-box DNA helicase 1-like isoform X2 [Liolophura sinensis]|uniref:F-box DNA helicase 1-like isoform X2 n=1 Tax=Liolophura sinensis TaxID=3198878 RepID=UPI0031588310
MLHADDDSDAFSSSEMNDNDLLDVVDRYGLLGSGRYPCDPVDKTNTFELLPAEVMENIFCFLPVQDLYLNANRVCKAWNQIISNPQFLHWKKKYFQLSKSYGSVRSEMIELLMENGMAEKNDFLTGLIRHMMNHKQLNSDRLLECLQKTPKYHWAIALMNERFMDCFLFGEPHPACVLAILVVIAKSVKDVSNLLTSLLSIQSKCSSIMILEALYCLATFFLAFKLRVRNGIFNGMHYRLYCALYLFENSAGNQGNVQSSLRRNLKEQHLRLGDSNLCLTNEQLRICNYEIRHGEVVKIVAFAGTGKTSTLLALTQIRPSMRFLLVVFNKAMRFHAAKKFPPNVCCKTGHSLAYETVGRRYNTAKKLGGDMKVYEVAQILPPRKGENLYIRSKHVLKTVRTFLASADEYITIDHTPADMLSEQGLKTPISPHLRKNYVVDAQFLWNKMKDIKCSEVKISHDGYLKLYQLRHPKLRNFDCILIDEAQDLTPAVADILLSQDQCKILVGDPHQQIYSFRGAVNALASVQASRVFYLTQSFRFGAEIAGVASTCLEFLKNEGRCLVGSNAPGSVCNDAVGQICIINRINFGLFSEAVKKCCYSEKEHKIHIIGGFQNFGFSMIQEIYTLTLSDQERRKAGRTITSKLLKHLGSIEALEKYAKDTMDLELSGKVKIVRCYQHNLPTCINAIQWRHVSDEAKADFIFTTAHKAKGLEFPAVRLGIDFITCLTSVQQLIDGSMHSLYTPSEDEKNLLYVAITRAQRVLQVSPALRDILKAAGENFEYIAFSKDLEAAKETVYLFRNSEVVSAKCSHFDGQ